MSKPDHNKLLEDGILAYRHGNKDLAHRLFKKAVKNIPNDFLSHRFLGAVEHDLGKLEDAQKSLMTAIRYAPPNESGPLEDLALIKLQNGRQEEAEALLQKAVKANPSSIEALLRLGAALITCGRASEAVDSYQAVISLDKKNFQAAYGLSHAYLECSDFLTAIESCKKALELKPEDAATLSIMGVSYYQLEDFTNAQQHLKQSCSINETDQNALVHLGRAQLKLGMNSDAIETFKKAATFSQGSSILYSQLANAYAATGDYISCIKICDEFLDSYPLSAALYQVKACALRDSGNDQEAAELLGQDKLVIVDKINCPRGFDGIDQFNHALEKMIYDHPTYSRSHSNRATRHGRQTGSLMVDPSPVMKEFMELVNSEVKFRIKQLQGSPEKDHPWVKNAPSNWSMNSWAVVLYDQGYQRSHIHPEAWLSGVYYVKIPGTINQDDVAGWIEFGEVTDQLHYTQDPKRRLVHPSEGTMVSFPSHSFHRVIPFRSDDVRISISFDLFALKTNRP
jgi:uncharacterized protein (TIGR02466 family)